MGMTRPFASVLLLLLAALAPGRALAAPDAEPWPRWERHDAGATATIDHSAWDGWLKRYVSADPLGVARVAYGRVGEDGRRALARYIDGLAAVAVSRHNRAEQRAFWINLYNALTVRVILDRYPVESILRINTSPGWLSIGPWGKKLVTVEGEMLSLDDIEHRILRPVWRDPRIHYAVNCASVGCPNLRQEAYTGARIEAQLDDQARAYVNSWRGAHFEDGGLYVSSIYKWYVADFGGNETGVLAQLRRYAGGDLAQRLAKTDRIAGYHYDWDLNDAAQPAAE
jgi:hypothetical protein